MDGGKRIGKWLYKDILLKAAEKYDWDQSAVTDLYVQNVYEETGGDVERFVKGIYDFAGKNKNLVTKEALMELLDSYGVIDPVNTPRTRDVVKFGSVTPQVPYRLPEQDGFNMQDAIDPLQAIRTPMDIQLDDVDGYYDSMQRLTPPQKETMALRRFQSAQKTILGKYGNGKEGQTRLQEQRAAIIKDFDLEEVDGQVRVKPAELKAYQVYCQGASYGSLQEDKVVELEDDNFAGWAEVFNEKAAELYKKRPREKKTPGTLEMGLMRHERTLDLYDEYHKAKQNAAMLFNDATIWSQKRNADAQERGTFGNVAMGTLEGIGDGVFGLVFTFLDFARSKAFMELKDKIQGLEGEELQARIQELTDEERNLLESAENYYRAVEATENDLPRSRRVGEMVGSALVGTAEFFATGGMGWLKSLSKVAISKAAVQAGKQVGKQAGKQIVTKAGKSVVRGGGVPLFVNLGRAGFTKKLLNTGQKMAKDQLFNVTEAALQAMIQPSFYAEVGDRISQGEPAGKAWAESLYDKWVDNYTERLFGGVPVLGTMIKGGAGKLAGLSEEILKGYTQELMGDFMKRIPDWNERGFEQAYTDFWKDKLDVFYSVALMTGMVEGAKGMKGLYSQMTKDTYRKSLPKDLVDNIDRLMDETDMASLESTNMLAKLLAATAGNNEIEVKKLTVNVHRYIQAKFQMKGMELTQNTEQNVPAQKVVVDGNAGEKTTTKTAAVNDKTNQLTSAKVPKQKTDSSTPKEVPAKKTDRSTQAKVKEQRQQTNGVVKAAPSLQGKVENKVDNLVNVRNGQRVTTPEQRKAIKEAQRKIKEAGKAQELASPRNR